MLRIEVPGKAAGAGSKRVIVRGGRARVIDASKNTRPWKNLVQDRASLAVAAAETNGASFPLEGPVVVDVIEYRARPKSHYTSKGALSAVGKRFPCPTGAPDRTKVARGAEDAIAGLVVRDDSQIVDGVVRKAWGVRDRTYIVVTRAGDPTDLIARYIALNQIAAEAAERQVA